MEKLVTLARNFIAMHRNTWIALILGLLIVLLLLGKARKQQTVPKPSPAPAAVVNTFVTQYAGVYTVALIESSSDEAREVYELKEDGTAKWMWIVPDAEQGVKVDYEKTGAWTASEGRIEISVQGNSGMITEVFELRSGSFYSTKESDRYLKQNQ